MAKFSSVNIDTSVNGGAAKFFALQQVLVAAGWTVQSSSDGTTYKATPGSQITHAGTGAGGMNNNSAWFRVQDPGGRREFCVQRSTSQSNWRITYSALDKFVGGSPDATHVPSATDSQTLIGSGTDASPGFSSMVAGAVGRYVSHVVAQSTPEGNVYGFWCFDSERATGGVFTQFLCEPMKVGSYPVADLDPCVVIASFQAPSYSTHPSGWYQMNGAGDVFVTFPPLVYAASSGGGLAGGVYINQNPYDGSDQGVPINFSRPSTGAQPGWKGCARYMLWKSLNRNYPATIDIGGDAYVYCGGMLLPWENGTLPLV